MDGLLVPAAHARVSGAMASFGQLSLAFFGTRSIDQGRRLRLGWSVVVSRLSYNVHVWSQFAYVSWRIMNTMYMRLWRRIYGQPRYCHVETSDQGIRAALGVPSLDCFICRRRLKYLSRLAGLDLPAFHALLQADDG